MDEYTIKLNDLIEQDIARALDMLFGDTPAKTVTRDRAEHVLKIAAQRVAGEAADLALGSLLSTEQMAAILNISTRRVRYLATEHQVGWQVSRGTWVFRAEDVKRLRPRSGPGRPRKTECSSD